ncbi:DUF397 domain-containing protein [Streptomyces sp. ISL-22]|uniref:DUF397 domain-containing protein n=1 Tax=Streptomyces curacoi TaxID=146536 RepID=A0A117PI16_9ACTN|nr:MULTISPECIES: DUF397 domain-containing protein [Streptomyces]KUM80032.1 hypothetical protein AQI70_07595 [Streptomyces curacoi]MBT2418590.1 DUF397 domain-containing protein [Streptomyces sp. ISL-24]MBT2434307.1 DUF397 domain-containing protein [Streptomyces sp. ISL-22]
MTQAILWQKSTFSGGGEGNTCVELAAGTPTTLHLRESDDPATILTTTRAPLTHLLQAIRRGQINPAVAPPSI